MGMRRVSVLGLGIVGFRVRERLVRAGYETTCWSRTFRHLDGEFTEPAAAVDGAQIVSMYLKDAQMVRDTFKRAKAGFQPGVLVVNHSTVDLPTTKWLASESKACGCSFLDAPFTGSKEAAEAGQLLYYTGGDEELVLKISDYLAVSSRGRLHCGDIGTATVTKLGTNLISACTIQAMSEAMVIAKQNGVAPEVFANAAIQNGSGSALMAMKYPRILANEFTPHFTLANMLKDSKYALHLAEEAGVELPCMTVVSKRMGRLCSEGHGEDDFSVLSKGYPEIFQNGTGC